MKAEIERTKVRKGFEFDLSVQEIADKAQLVAKSSQRKGELEDEFDGIKSEMKGKIAELERAASEELRKIRLKKEWREVECTEVRDFERLLVEYDVNGEIMESRPMTAEERQTKLKLAATTGVTDKPLTAPIGEQVNG